MSMNKKFVSYQQYIKLSTELGLMWAEQYVLPDMVVGVWRGGALPAIVVQEVFVALGHPCRHLCISASSYTAIAEHGMVELNGCQSLIEQANDLNNILFVDDIVDSGNTFSAISQWGKEYLPSVNFHFAAVFGRSEKTFNAMVALQDDDWLVFPHELEGLSDTELLQHEHIDQRQFDRIVALRQDK